MSPGKLKWILVQLELDNLVHKYIDRYMAVQDSSIAESTVNLLS